MTDARSLLDRDGRVVRPACWWPRSSASWSARQFFAPANLELMARQTAIVCMAALGMTIGDRDRRHRPVGRLDDRADDGRDRADAARGVRAADRGAPPAWPRRRCAGWSTASSSRGSRRALHRHARDDADRARRGEGGGRRAARRSADHLAERPAANAGAARSACRPASGW